MTRRTIGAIALALALLGCSKLTLENYNKLETGMSHDEVTTLLGEPERCDDVLGVRNCTWGDGTRSVSVNFVGGKVLLFSATNLK